MTLTQKYVVRNITDKKYNNYKIWFFVTHVWELDVQELFTKHRFLSEKLKKSGTWPSALDS